MQRYKKRPVEVEAVQLTDAMLENMRHPERVPGVQYDRLNQCAWIKTPAGTLACLVGSWIVRNAEGALCPVKPKTFEAMYEPVIGPEAPAGCGSG